ncbi:hypothetical protein TNCV_3663331 [Trichonephila clavipes]|nr:hypothetical protein TNCV_3663331 [Trichonephila clavipes]
MRPGRVAEVLRLSLEGKIEVSHLINVVRYCAQYNCLKIREYVVSLSLFVSKFTETNHSLKSSVVIHAFLFERYLVGNEFMPLKHRGFADFPMTRGVIFSESSMFTNSGERAQWDFKGFGYIDIFGSHLL